MRVRSLSVVTVVATLLSLLTALAGHSAAAPSRVSTHLLVRQLPVAREHARGYDRGKFPLWIDADHDGCDTRDEVLIAEAVRKPRVGSGCTLRGGKWRSPYDGVTTRNPSTFDIDHLVPLAEAWRSGAYRWSTSTRQRYANDLGYGPDLVAVTAHANRSKGDSEPSAYLPPRRRFDCTYEAWWVAVKWRWHLSVDRAEKSWLIRHLRRCGWPTVQRPSRPAIRTQRTGGTHHRSSASGAKITAIYFNSPGSDDGSNASLNAEWVQISNVTRRRTTVTGWTLSDASGHRYSVPGLTLAPGARVKVHTGSGRNTSRNLYWRETSYIWNNTGDTATLRNSAGRVVDRCSYATAADPEATC